MTEIKFSYQAFGDLWSMVRCGVEAEKAGFDSIWVGDHFTFWFPEREYPETFITLSLIGSRTKRIRIGPGVTDVFRRHPALLAQIIATLDVLTGGRTNLGIGAGEKMNITPFGISFNKPISRIRESLTIIKMLWNASLSSPANFKGKFYELKDAFIQIKPIQKPHPPIYIAATGPVARRLVGEIADGWYAHLHSPQTFKEALKEIQKGAETVGRRLEEIDKVAFIPTSVSKDFDMAKKAILLPASLILVLAKEKLKQLGFVINSPEWMTLEHMIINPQNMELLMETASKLPFEAVELTTAFGTPDHVIDKFEAFIKMGATNIDILNCSPNREESIELFSKEIIPYFRERYRDLS